LSDILELPLTFPEVPLNSQNLSGSWRAVLPRIENAFNLNGTSGIIIILLTSSLVPSSLQFPFSLVHPGGNFSDFFANP
jgi:hypothetical protein